MKRNEDSIYDGEIVVGRSAGGGYGAGRVGNISGRRGREVGERIARRISAGRNFVSEWRVYAMGRRGRFAGGRQRAAAGTAAGFAGYGVSASCVAGDAEDSARNNEELQPDRASGRKAVSSEGSGASLRHESCFDCGAVPPSGARGWESCRVSMGTFAERNFAGAGAGVIRNPVPTKKNESEKQKRRASTASRAPPATYPRALGL